MARKPRKRSVRRFTEDGLYDEKHYLVNQPTPPTEVSLISVLKHQYDRRKKVVKRK